MLYIVFLSLGLKPGLHVTFFEPFSHRFEMGSMHRFRESRPPCRRTTVSKSVVQ